MKKLLAPLIILGIVTLSGCSLITDFIDSKKQEANTVIQEEKDKLVETAKTKLEDIKTGVTENLSGKNLTKMPMSTFDQKDIEVLDISNNQLTGALPGEIRFLKNLKVLKANNNLMTGVPAEIGQLSNLEILDLSNNQLTGLPNELANLKNLKTFNISGNNYSEQDLNYIKERLPNTNFILK